MSQSALLAPPPSPASWTSGQPSIAPAPQIPSSRLKALDGLRGLAVLLVLLDHASDAKLRIFPGADLNRAGKYGVYLFFVLSAFLLTHLLLLRPASELAKARTWLDYFLRRFLRIFPPYALVLCAMIGLHHLTAPQVLNHLLLRAGIKQFWTIPVEVKFYLLLPLLVLSISWIRAKAWIRGFLALLGLGVLSYGVFSIEPSWSLHPTLLLSQNLPPFLLGTLAALLHAAFSRLVIRRPKIRWILEFTAIAALGVSLVRIPAIYNAVFQPQESVSKLSSDPAICGLLWTALILGTIHGQGLVRRAMEWFPLRYLGLISFSAYLWHIKFLRDVDDLPVPYPVRLIAFLALVIAVATVSYFCVEKPLSKVRLSRVSAHA